MDELIDKIEGLVRWCKRLTDSKLLLNVYLKN